MRHSIVRLGHPALRFASEPVDVERLADGELQRIFDDLREALAATQARVLTAPQLGTELQVLVYRSGQEAADGPLAGIRVLLNPMLEPEHGDLVYDWEGCLSVPGLRGLVPRYPTVRMRGVDENGQPVDLTAEGQEARVLQHAHDHLSGVVFLDRMRDLRSLAFNEEWEEFLSAESSETGNRARE